MREGAPSTILGSPGDMHKRFIFICRILRIKKKFPVTLLFKGYLRATRISTGYLNIFNRNVLSYPLQNQEWQPNLNMNRMKNKKSDCFPL